MEKIKIDYRYNLLVNEIRFYEIVNNNNKDNIHKNYIKIFKEKLNIKEKYYFNLVGCYLTKVEPSKSNFKVYCVEINTEEKKELKLLLSELSKNNISDNINKVEEFASKHKCK